MNTTAGDGGFFGNSNNSGYSYGIGVSIGILILITTITLASYFCTRADTHPPSHGASGDARGQRQTQPPPQSFVIDVGIDEATLHTYPKLLYSKANLAEKHSTATCCSICLADYKRNDMLRLLPDCNHIFHLKCVDPWLRLHPTCPVCRTSPLPTPQSTPLAEVVPLAAATAAQRS